MQLIQSYMARNSQIWDSNLTYFSQGPYQGNTFPQIKLECVKKKKGNMDFKSN